MSWFRELTSKAEAMLVKLDQDAAQTLQNYDSLLSKPNLLDQQRSRQQVFRDENDVIDSLSDVNVNSIRPQTTRELENNLVSGPSSQIQTGLSHNNHENKSLEYPTKANQQSYKTEEIDQSTLGSRLSNMDDENHGGGLEDTPLVDAVQTPRLAESSTDTGREGGQKVERYSKNFPIHTSRNILRKFTDQKNFPHRDSRLTNYNDELATTSDKRIENFDNFDESLGADSIRASINKSLQEYTTRRPVFCPKNSSNNWLAPSTTTHDDQKHYDQQPKLVTSSSSSMIDTINNQTSRLESPSGSFSVEFPIEQSAGAEMSDITSRLLKNSVSRKKKSTFYLHKVINRLANTDSMRTGSMMSDQTRIKFRRMQIRAGSYIRRLNYYFQTYPMMKFVVLGYLALMQILIIYVLFFYQSSSSLSNDLSTQIKQQQKEFAEPH